MAAALKICSFSGLRSSLLRPDRDVHAGMDLYGRHTGFSPASRHQAKGRRYYLSQNIGPAVAGSAGPAPAPL